MFAIPFDNTRRKILLGGQETLGFHFDSLQVFRHENGSHRRRIPQETLWTVKTNKSHSSGCRLSTERQKPSGGQVCSISPRCLTMMNNPLSVGGGVFFCSFLFAKKRKTFYCFFLFFLVSLDIYYFCSFHFLPFKLLSIKLTNVFLYLCLY